MGNPLEIQKETPALASTLDALKGMIAGKNTAADVWERAKGISASAEFAKLRTEVSEGLKKTDVTEQAKQQLALLNHELRSTTTKTVDSVKDTGNNVAALAKEQAEFFANPTVSTQEKFLRGGMIAAGAAGILWLGKKFVNFGKNPSVFGKIVRGLGLAALGGWAVNRFAPKQVEKTKERTYMVSGKEVSETEYREAFNKLPRETKETALRPFNAPSQAYFYEVSKIEFRATDGTTLVLPIEDFRKEIEKGAIPKPDEMGLFVPPTPVKEPNAPSTTKTAPAAVAQNTPNNAGQTKAPVIPNF